jgi:hypothetical protein
MADFYIFVCRVLKTSGQNAFVYLEPDSLKKTVSFLASDSLKGRADFTPALEKAAVFISGEFEKAGLQNPNYYLH